MTEIDSNGDLVRLDNFTPPPLPTHPSHGPDAAAADSSTSEGTALDRFVLFVGNVVIKVKTHCVG